MNYYFKVLKNYANFNGRARRSEYWYFVLFNTIITIVLKLIEGVNHYGVIGTIYSLAVLLPYLGVTIRRMHDVDKSGWFCLIPIYNLILACTDGTPGDNEYGPDPKGGSGYGADDYVKPYDAQDDLDAPVNPA